jgi:hypothetical protein
VGRPVCPLWRENVYCSRLSANGRPGLNPEKLEMAKISNLQMKIGPIGDVIAGSDVFIGVYAPGTVTPEMVRSMAKDPIILATGTTDAASIIIICRTRLAYIPERRLILYVCALRLLKTPAKIKSAKKAVIK